MRGGGGGEEAKILGCMKAMLWSGAAKHAGLRLGLTLIADKGHHWRKRLRNNQ